MNDLTWRCTKLGWSSNNCMMNPHLVSVWAHPQGCQSSTSTVAYNILETWFANHPSKVDWEDPNIFQRFECVVIDFGIGCGSKICLNLTPRPLVWGPTMYKQSWTLFRKVLWSQAIEPMPFMDVTFPKSEQPAGRWHKLMRDEGKNPAFAQLIWYMFTANCSVMILIIPM